MCYIFKPNFTKHVIMLFTIAGRTLAYRFNFFNKHVDDAQTLFSVANLDQKESLKCTCCNVISSNSGRRLIKNFPSLFWGSLTNQVVFLPAIITQY